MKIEELRRRIDLGEFAVLPAPNWRFYSDPYEYYLAVMLFDARSAATRQVFKEATFEVLGITEHPKAEDAWELAGGRDQSSPSSVLAQMEVLANLMVVKQPTQTEEGN